MPLLSEFAGLFASAIAAAPEIADEVGIEGETRLVVGSEIGVR